MLNDLLTNYLFNKLIDENHPTIEYDGCINKNQRKKVCTACQTFCSQGIIKSTNLKKIDWYKCINCNICVSVCPSRTIRSSSSTMNKILNIIYEVKGEEIILACHKEEISVDIKLHCIASYPWEILACLALERPVIIVRRSCDSCSEKSSDEKLIEIKLKRVREFLGEELYNKRIIINDIGSAMPQKHFSRRDMFAFILKKTKATITTLLPEDASIKLDGILYRKVLLNRLKNIKYLNIDQKKFGWYTPVFGSRCWGCGICEKVCPQKAIHISEGEKGTRIINHTVWKCDSCRVCENVCINKAIEGMKLVYIYNAFLPVKTKIKSAVCKECGAPVKPEAEEELCMSCYSKKKYLKPI
ncbi:ferredoxin 2 [Clostridium pasteurianum DSM 525 = ATCC 6013]|uniref:Ferredoxin n=1 Tax=Clostridium pasteurianum DSM 525 = ATCC 6013 TaxID=1262449 RepID=A0A0H3J8D2_CLOPA|nr:4Fe-4S dicluster domain-containing protein [Clostridium pasteurianum]AJA49477.1 ferredoxin 2 [Clostridium pasteurianum DSM 525 = ATCC 6013]AJA53465.1 ferredoxin 2 [Clostridium pasteurianum DSM 525 = ATCC 6013]AOZ76641.1 ferredoxin [Clostridium pasteurianum DSM 525 = ATCC 6013]AOZ80438.1 ferredoxin [Clostridium pasteurianum]ELP58408.1 ferredoxin 2 [Clostridium pasteurianum DSM 525 = ATCC 6013]